MTEDSGASVGGPGTQLVLAVLLVSMAVLGVLDLFLDAPRDWLSLHILVELALITLCLGSAFFFGRAWHRSQHSLSRVRQMLEERRQERDEWRTRTENLLRGLGEAMDEQLDAWGLTPTEKETALLLLKGRSHKDAARLCHRSERTVRQHAVNVYRKSGLAGRAELAAFFLEDLLLPQSQLGAERENQEEAERSIAPGGTPA